MKTKPTRLFLACMAVLCVVSPCAFAYRELGIKMEPTGKFYIAETAGDSQIQTTNDKISTVRQATAFDAPDRLRGSQEQRPVPL